MSSQREGGQKSFKELAGGLSMATAESNSPGSCGTARRARGKSVGDRARDSRGPVAGSNSPWSAVLGSDKLVASVSSGKRRRFVPSSGPVHTSVFGQGHLELLTAHERIRHRVAVVRSSRSGANPRRTIPPECMPTLGRVDLVCWTDHCSGGGDHPPSVALLPLAGLVFLSLADPALDRLAGDHRLAGRSRAGSHGAVRRRRV